MINLLNKFSQSFVYRERQDCGTPKQLLLHLHSDDIMRRCFPMITKLVNLINIVPTSTASVERGFSLMNSLCTPLRNRLNQVQLESLMRICEEGPNDLSPDMLNDPLEIFKNKKDRLIYL